MSTDKRDFAQECDKFANFSNFSTIPNFIDFDNNSQTNYAFVINDAIDKTN